MSSSSVAVRISKLVTRLASMPVVQFFLRSSWTWPASVECLAGHLDGGQEQSSRRPKANVSAEIGSWIMGGWWCGIRRRIYGRSRRAWLRAKTDGHLLSHILRHHAAREPQLGGTGGGGIQWNGQGELIIQRVDVVHQLLPIAELVCVLVPEDHMPFGF